MTRLWRALAAGVLVAVTLPWAAPAHAGDVEQVDSYDVQMKVNQDGSMDVVETVQYDFGTSTDKHGFYRTLVTQQDHGDGKLRRYPLSDVEVSSPTNAPADVDVDRDDEAESGTVRLRVGDPDRTVSGVQTYRISYRLGAVLNGFSDHAELYWNVVGSGFDVPIQQTSVRVSSPGDVTRVQCYVGPTGSRDPCAGAEKSGTTATFDATELDSGDAFTVVVGLPKGSASTTPVLVDKPGIRTDFGLSVANVVGVVLALGLGGAFAWWLRRVRARHGGTVSSVPAGAYSLATLRSGASGSGVLVPQDGGTVEFRPPGGLRPGQVGTLYDDTADTVDVTATVVDLAVRGYLAIDELPGGDWGLRMLRPPGPEFLPYERKFFDTLFLGKPDRVQMSTLRNTFAGTLAAIKDLMYADMKERGWFVRRRPDVLRKVWMWAGIVTCVLSCFVLWTTVTGAHQPTAVASLAFALLGGGVIWGSQRIPAKSAAGNEAYAQVTAFKDEMESLDFAALPEQSRDEVMSRYLPYAMAFGQTTKWTAAFQQLDGRRGNRPMYWYYSPYPWDPHRFGTMMTSFATTTGSTFSSTPGGSGSSGFSGGGGGGGFSGGGGGGGGGGSW